MWSEALISWGLPSLGLVAWLVVTVLLVRRLLPSLAGRPTPTGRRRLVQAIYIVTFLLGVWIWGRLVPLPDAAHRFWLDDLQPWFWGTLALVLFYAFAFPLFGRLSKFVQVRAARTGSSIDDVLLASARRPSHVLILLLGFVLWVDIVPAPVLLQRRVGLVVEAAVVVVIVLFLDALIVQLIERRRATSRVLATAGTVLRAMARVVLFIVGILMVLGTIGIDVTPVVASLGVGSLAIGLAMQSTLEDFIAGLLIAADQPVSMGDYVEIGDEKTSGTIDHIGWRTTRILTRERTKVVIPNSVLARATLINRSRPSPVVRFQGEVGVHYDSDLRHVARVVQQVAAELQLTSEFATRDFTPVVTFFSFGESSVDLRVWLEAIDWPSHYRLRDAFIVHLHERFRAEAILIPYPIRTLDLPSALVESMTHAPAKS